MKKKDILSVIDSLEKINDIIAKDLKSNISPEMETLINCQETTIEIGNEIEKIGQKGEEIVHLLEAYCENLYLMDCSKEDINQTRKMAKKIQKQLMQIRNKVIYDLPEDKKQVVFLPYKASMWDSLESIWKAADADPDCEAYVIPIPYYDKNADGSFSREHYEGDKYPDYVPITHYNDYNFEGRHPDVIFIHNPYDQYNSVTSVHPFFYSKNLKQFTDLLVYVPYYSTSGGMSAAQSQCIAYYYADYIVIQSEKYRKFFDANLPDEKFLPLGSPKFDKVVNICKNPPEPPEEWKEKMAGKKVYFYNTSIAGMLKNTPAFLKKMEYVFRCFTGRNDVCLLWRPHPLLESTFDSMRPEYRSIYDALKNYFMVSGLGIYDDTPDMINTIALCDAYIGDEGTSATSLFGIGGKPVFILNNNIHHAPKEDDWRGEIITPFRRDGYDEWKITQGNKLYHASNHDYQYKYYYDLTEYAARGYYTNAIEINGKVYVCPASAQDILVVQDHKIIKKIELKYELEQRGAFCSAWRINHYIFLIPNQYPAIVRLDTCNDEVSYLYEGKDVFVKEVKGKRRIGGGCVWEKYMLVASPDDNHVLAIDSETMEIQILSTMSKNHCGCLAMVAAETEIWLLPYDGTTITRWNPVTGEMREYSDYPAGFQCYNKVQEYECMERPFNMAVPYRHSILLSPAWGNMFILLNTVTGEMTEWKLPFPAPDERINEYYPMNAVGCFIRRTDLLGEWTYRYFHVLDRRLYDINLDTGEYKEIPIVFDIAELKEHAAGFERMSDWIQYSCMENAFNSLLDFLEGQITGHSFDRNEQKRAYQEIAANSADGTCGEKVYQFIKEKCDSL